MATSSTAALRKRAQIAKANRTMFIWIALCSAVVGSSLVVSYFLVQKLVYNEKVLFEKNKTVSTLTKNIAMVPELEAQVRVLETNSDLASARANEDDQTIQVILDALPSDANSLALGASLQSRLLSGVDGVSIESLQVEPVVGVESSSGSTDGSAVEEGAAADANGTPTGEEGSQYTIAFRFSVNGDQEGLKKILQNLERSIRLIDVRTLRVESQGPQQQMTVAGFAYYEPSVKVELKEVPVPL